MIGRQVILTNRAFTLEELYRPTKASVEEYILLPATRRFMTIVYPRKAGGLFSKDNKVILSTADTPAGAHEGIAQAIPTGNIFIGAAQMANLSSSEQERKGPAEGDLTALYGIYEKVLS